MNWFIDELETYAWIRYCVMCSGASVLFEHSADNLSTQAFVGDYDCFIDLLVSYAFPDEIFIIWSNAFCRYSSGFDYSFGICRSFEYDFEMERLTVNTVSRACEKFGVEEQERAISVVVETLVWQFQAK